MVLFCACGKDLDTLPKQQEAITRYLTGNNFDYTLQDGVYKRTPNKDRTNYPNEPIVNVGDSVTFNFEAYTFTTSPGTLFYTNKPYLIEAMSNLNSQYWPKSPIKVKAGATEMVEGVARGLIQCRQGDSVQLFITSDLAFHDKAMGTIEPNMAIMYVLNIENVKK